MKEKRRKKITARDPLVKTFNTGRMMAWKGSHWVTQRLMAHTALRGWLIHLEDGKEGRKEMICF